MSNIVYHVYPPRRTRSSMGSPTAVSSAAAQPIRVTDEALESLLYCIAHTVEFQRTIGTNLPKVIPVDITSEMLGGITYVACKSHNEALTKTIPMAVQKAKKLPAAASGGVSTADATFVLRIKVIKVVSKTTLLWTTKTPNIIEEWEFQITKVEGDVSHQPFRGVRTRSASQNGGGGTKTPSPPPQENSSTIPQTAADGAMTNPSGLDLSPLGTAGGQQQTGSSKSPSSEEHSGGIQQQILTPSILSLQGASNTSSVMQWTFANDPRQMRDVVKFVVNKSFEAIDTYLAKDFAGATEMQFEVSVEERSRER